MQVKKSIVIFHNETTVEELLKSSEGRKEKVSIKQWFSCLLKGFLSGHFKGSKTHVSMKDGICFPPLWWYAHAHDAVCGQPSVNLPARKWAVRKWFVKRVSSNLLLTQIVSDDWINPLFVWRHNDHLLFLCGFPYESHIRLWQQWLKGGIFAESWTGVVLFRWKQWEFIWLEMLEKDYNLKSQEFFHYLLMFMSFQSLSSMEHKWRRTLLYFIEL